MNESRLVAAKNARVRRHGFQPPYSCLQLLSWVAAFILLVSFIMAIVCLIILRKDSALEMLFIIVLVVTYAISYACMIVYTYRVTVSDPTDPTVALERQFKEQNNISFQTKDYSYYCDICDTHVLIDTKHC